MTVVRLYVPSLCFPDHFGAGVGFADVDDDLSLSTLSLENGSSYFHFLQSRHFSRTLL
jgi:hypothetical protein